MPSIRNPLIALALVGASWLDPSAHAAAPRPMATAPELIVAAESAASDALSAPRESRAVTLSYRVLEIFAGEPGAATIVVRHDELARDERARLLLGERVILLARPDGAAAGRWVASAPLRATPAALAAFRRWSAPEDVRAAAPLDDVLAEVAQGDAARPGVAGAAPSPVALPTRPVPDVAVVVEPAPVVVPAGPPAARAVAAPAHAEPAAPAMSPLDVRVQVSEDQVVAHREIEARPAPVSDLAERPVPPAAPDEQKAPAPAPPSLPAPRASARVSAVQPAASSPPTTAGDLAARAGRGAPGLPPMPAGRVLGTPLEARSDLTPPLRGSRGR